MEQFNYRITFCGKYLLVNMFGGALMKKVLIIEDDKNINEMLQELLSNNGYNVSSAYSGTEALLIHNKQIDLIVLDLMLPGKNGEEIIKKLKTINDVPIIITTAINDIDKKLDLFELGADDYITKPFNNAELLARIKVHLRKTNTDSKDIITIDDVEINKKSYSVVCNNKNINLSKIEFDILKLLMENNNQVVTKSILFDNVWGNIDSADENTLNVHISKIRNKLKKSKSKQRLYRNYMEYWI